jgi:Flp pilus assembly pilin Flp
VGENEENDMSIQSSSFVHERAEARMIRYGVIVAAIVVTTILVVQSLTLVLS